MRLNETDVHHDEATVSLKIILLIFALVLIGALAYFVWYQNRYGYQIQEIPTTTDQPAQSITETDDLATGETKNWKMHVYASNDHGFSFRYPADWQVLDVSEEQAKAGELVRVVGPQQEDHQDGQEHGQKRNLILSYFKDINDEYARGGSWEGQRTYQNLSDYFTDQNAPKKRLSQTTVAGKKAYEILITGEKNIYGIMVEFNGIYELKFLAAQSKSDLSLVEKQILSTFKFTKSSQ